MKRQTKLNSTEQQQGQAAEQHAQNKSALEFATPEDLLRYDAARTTVPAKIAERLKKSAHQAPDSRPSWWRRFLGGNP